MKFEISTRILDQWKRNIINSTSDKVEGSVWKKGEGFLEYGIIARGSKIELAVDHKFDGRLATRTLSPESLFDGHDRTYQVGEFEFEIHKRKACGQIVVVMSELVFNQSMFNNCYVERFSEMVDEERKYGYAITIDPKVDACFYYHSGGPTEEGSESNSHSIHYHAEVDAFKYERFNRGRDCDGPYDHHEEYWMLSPIEHVDIQSQILYVLEYDSFVILDRKVEI